MELVIGSIKRIEVFTIKRVYSFLIAPVFLFDKYLASVLTISSQNLSNTYTRNVGLRIS
jgi:hypothetical protein